MTDRMLDSQNAGEDCGCGPFNDPFGCEVATYAKCPVTFQPISRKTTRRFKFNFYRPSCDDCRDCDNEYYQKIRTTMIEKRNPPDCLDSQGFIRITNESIERDTGIFSFSLDANDRRLTPGERFLITVWARLPDTSELPISAYISIH